MPYKCCVLGCNYEGQKGFHSFPSDQVVAAKWVNVIKARNTEQLLNRLKAKKLSHSYNQICKKHFNPKDYVTVNGDRRLKKGAIPSLCLPDLLLTIKKEHDYALVNLCKIFYSYQLNEWDFFIRLTNVNILTRCLTSR